MKKLQPYLHLVKFHLATIPLQVMLAAVCLFFPAVLESLDPYSRMTISDLQCPFLLMILSAQWVWGSVRNDQKMPDWSGHHQFLWGLPVERRRVFLIKAAHLFLLCFLMVIPSIFYSFFHQQMEVSWPYSPSKQAFVERLVSHPEWKVKVEKKYRGQNIARISVQWDSGYRVSTSFLLACTLALATIGCFPAIRGSGQWWFGVSVGIITLVIIISPLFFPKFFGDDFKPLDYYWQLLWFAEHEKTIWAVLIAGGFLILRYCRTRYLAGG